MDKAIHHLKQILKNTTTVHLDMGGDHRYALNHRAHKIITAAKAFIASEPANTADAKQPCEICEHSKRYAAYNYCPNCGMKLRR